MKHLLFVFIVLFGGTSFSQSSAKYMYYQSLFPAYEYSGRTTAAIKKEKLQGVTSLSDIAPDLWRNMVVMPHNERFELERRLGVDYPKDYAYGYPKESIYNDIIDYVSVEISVTTNGKFLTAKSPNHKLTADQKSLLNAADLGTDIDINLKFKYKKEIAGDHNKIISGKVTVTVVPEKEAEYPGGFKRLTEYLTDHILHQLPEAAGKSVYALVKFTVNAEGSITESKIARTSGDAKIDQLILNAIYNMPKWKPAENGTGAKVKQEFTIPVGGGGGC